MTSDHPKILFCAFDVIPAPTGSSSRATDFLRGLTDAFTVDALTAKSPDLSHIERYFGARLLRVPVGGGDLPARAQAFQRAVRRQLESDEYPIVLFTDPFGGYALCEVRSQYGFKLVYDAFGLPSIDIRYTHPHLEGDPRFLAKLRRQELFCLMNADAVLVGSELAAAHVASLGVDRVRIAVLRAFADLSLYPKPDLPRPDRSPARFVYLGSQVAWQGLPLLLRGFAAAAASVDVRLSIVGPRHTSWRLQLEELAKELKIAAQVEFGNPVPHEQLAPVLGAADVAVAPLADLERNRSQGASLGKVAHYLAAGRPVLAADLPVCRELLDDSCARFFRAGDEADLGRAIVDLARDAARRTAMGEAARARAERTGSALQARQKLADLALSLVQRPAGAAQPDAGAGRKRARVGSEPTQPQERMASDPPTQPGADGRRPDADTDENRVGGEEMPTDIRAAPDHTTDPSVEVAGRTVAAASAAGGSSPAPTVVGTPTVADPGRPVQGAPGVLPPILPERPLPPTKAEPASLPVLAGVPQPPLVPPIAAGREAPSPQGPNGIGPSRAAPLPFIVRPRPEPSAPPMLHPSSAPVPSVVRSGAAATSPQGRSKLGSDTAPTGVERATAASSAAPLLGTGAPPPPPDEWIAHLVFGYAPPADGSPAAPPDPAPPRGKPRRSAFNEDSSPGVKM